MEKLKEILEKERHLWFYVKPEDYKKFFLFAKQNGFRGVPSATELVADADSIQEMLDNLSYNLTKNVELVKDKEVEQDILGTTLKFFKDRHIVNNPKMGGGKIRPRVVGVVIRFILIELKCFGHTFLIKASGSCRQSHTACTTISSPSIV